MPITRIDDHAEQAVGLLIEQYQNKPRLEALLLSYVDEAQDLENAFWDVFWKRLIDNAEGAQLDTIGSIVGEARRSRPDSIYRLYVLARIRINWSHGHPRDVIEVLRIVDPATFTFFEQFPAACDVEYDGAPAASGQDLANLGGAAVSAGVRFGVVLGDELESSLTWGEFEGEVSEEQGMADSGETVGGTASAVFEP
jgi:hypothetical protein